MDENNNWTTKFEIKTKIKNEPKLNAKSELKLKSKIENRKPEPHGRAVQHLFPEPLQPPARGTALPRTMNHTPPPAKKKWKLNLKRWTPESKAWTLRQGSSTPTSWITASSSRARRSSSNNATQTQNRNEWNESKVEDWELKSKLKWKTGSVETEIQNWS